MAPLYPGILKHYEDVRGRKIYSGVYDEYKTSINKTLAVFTDLGITVQVAGKRRVCGVLVSESSDSQIFISLEEHPVDYYN